jgi:hypothetical protein
MNTYGRPRILSPLDIIIIIALLAGACWAWPFLASHGPATVVVYRDDVCIARYPLASDKIVPVRGKGGAMTLSIHANTVRVIESSCPRGICVQTGAILRRGQQIVCAPNHILIEVETSSGAAVDAITQ